MEEQRERNREYQRKIREKAKNDPDSRSEILEKERQRWKKRVEHKKVRQIGDLGSKGAEASEKLLEGCSEKV